MITMKIENNKVYFINYGKLTSSDYTRLIVMGDKVEEVYNKLLQDLSSGDYIVHALYDIEHENVICLDDNTHACIEDQIDAFLDGLEYAGADVTVNVCYVVVEAAYSEEEVRDAMAAHEYVEVEY